MKLSDKWQIRRENGFPWPDYVHWLVIPPTALYNSMSADIHHFGSGASAFKAFANFKPYKEN